MRKKFRHTFAAALALTGLAACNDYNEYDNSYILDNDETMIVSASAEYIELDELTPSDEAVLTFTWTEARQMPEEYTIEYLPEIDLKIKAFSEGTRVRIPINEGEFSCSFTTEQLQNWITDKWHQSVNYEVVISFRVIARWTGGTKFAMPEVKSVDVTVKPYRPLVFDADKVYLEGAVTGHSVQQIKQTVENEYIFAVYDDFNAGDLGIRTEYNEVYQYLAPEEGYTGDFKDGVAIPARMVEPEEGSDPMNPILPDIAKWKLPESGKYRVIVDMEEHQVTIYGPGNPYNEEYVIPEWYPSDDEANEPVNQVMNEDADLWLRGACVGWSADGRAMNIVQSLVDPKMFYYSGSAFNGRTDFAVCGPFDSFNINNMAVLAPPLDTPDCMDGDNKNDVDGNGIKGNGAVVTMDVPMKFEIGGGDYRSAYWAVPAGTNYVVFNFRDMTVTFSSR